MTKDEKALLLTVARICLARIKEEQNDPSGNNEQDYYDLLDALRPFGALRTGPVNEAGK